MITSLWSIFDDGREQGRKAIGIYVLLIAANVAAWAWALAAFRDFPVLLGTAMLAYSFGLRHATPRHATPSTPTISWPSIT
jgi:nickel/cobalt transporter (NiCoT) family protein